MKGKVFESSRDVYQDQAQVLFDFYLNAAQKIIDQEDDYDKKSVELDEEIASINESASHVGRDYIIGGALLLIGLVILFVNPIIGAVVAIGGCAYIFKTYRFKKNVQSEIDEVEQKKQEIANAKACIFRDYKVNKIGAVYIPVAKKVAFGDKSVVVDLTDGVAPTNVSLQVANNPSALVNTLKDLEKLSTEAPVIEKSEQVEEVETSDYSSSIQDVKFYDYFGMLDRTLRTGAYYLSDVSTKDIKVPFILPDSKQMDYLNMFATTELDDEDVKVPVFNESRYDKEMEDFKKISDFQAQFAKENEDFEGVLKHLIANIGVAVQTVATMKVASNNKLIDSSNQLLFTILKNSYNHYSPLLEHDEIEKIRNTNFNYSDTVDGYKPFQLKESSRVKYDAQTGNWVAEDGTVTTMPFGISQIQEEIVAPIVQNLLAETRIERMRIYNDIKNQKINYLNKWHQDTEDFYGRNRTSSDDLLNIMRSNMTKFLAAQATVESVSEIKSSMKTQMLAGKKSEELENKSDKQDENNLAAFELQSQQFRKAQDDFDDYMDRLKDDIDEKARNFEYIEYYDASLRDRLAKDLVSAGDNQDQLDDRRRPLASINPLYAQASVLPPSPSVDDSVSEQLSLNVALYAANTLTEIDEYGKNGNVVDPQVENEQILEDDIIADDSSEKSDNDGSEVIESSQPEDASGSDSPEGDVAEKEKSYSVILMSAGAAKLQVVKAIKETFDLGLSEAKELVESAPTPIIQNVSLEEAEELKKVIEATGAEVDLMEE